MTSQELQYIVAQPSRRPSATWHIISAVEPIRRWSAPARRIFSNRALVVLDLHLEGEGRADDRLLRVVAVGDPHRALVAVGAGTAARPEQVVVDRVVGHADRGPAVDQVGQRHRPVGHAAQEVRGAVDRVDDPEARRGLLLLVLVAEQVVRGLGAGQALAAALLAEHAGRRGRRRRDACGSAPRPRGRRRSRGPARPCARRRAGRA